MNVEKIFKDSNIYTKTVVNTIRATLVKKSEIPMTIAKGINDDYDECYAVFTRESFQFVPKDLFENQYTLVDEAEFE